jgi:hypothetical protein
MSDFPEGIAVPEGAQELVDVCKETWAVIQDEPSDVNTNGEAVDRYGIAMDELNELGVHVNNEGDFPVFTLGVKDTAYDPSLLITGWSTISGTAEGCGAGGVVSIVPLLPAVVAGQEEEQ